MNRLRLHAAPPWVRAAVAVLVFALTFALRVRGVASHFYLLGDQIRDWEIALRRFSDLPLVGPPTHVGGYTVGPAFYWILWAMRVTIGPFFNNLPHAGGIGQAALQSAADAALCLGIWRRTHSVWVALTTIALVATAAFDLNLAAIVWNPTMGTALAKCTVAAILLNWHGKSWLHAAAAAAVAWAAVQSYTGTIFVVVGAFTAFLIDPLVRKDWPMLKRNVIVIGAVVALLQLPYVLHQVTHDFRDRSMGAVTNSVGRVLSGERGPEVGKSVQGYVKAFADIEVAPESVPYVGWLLLVCCAIVAVRHYADVSLLAITLLPQALAIAGYALFLAPLDDYYYLSLMPVAVLTVILALTAIPEPRLRLAAGVLVFVAALRLVPDRIRHEQVFPRLPEYRLLVDASRKIKSVRQPMRAIKTEFTLPPTASPEFLFEVLGGRLDPSAEWMCLIRTDGTLQYERVPPS